MHYFKYANLNINIYNILGHFNRINLKRISNPVKRNCVQDKKYKNI